MIYICGSLLGIAAVRRVLNEMLGAHRVSELIEQGRYRRDVY
ncbi:Iron-uptake factor [Pseudomonas syringae pv. maculicola]|nr:Iron-uptake factor [Pseudomonas syringae pv. maculicola str. M6]KPX71118.1 Iron-uptake factor [Pseudomonas syringae pv. maculicola]